MTKMSTFGVFGNGVKIPHVFGPFDPKKVVFGRFGLDGVLRLFWVKMGSKWGESAPFWTPEKHTFGPVLGSILGHF